MSPTTSGLSPRQIHPTAVIDPRAILAPDITVGPFAVIEGEVQLGPGCVVGTHAQLIGPLIAGHGNDFGRGCIVGERPQHVGYRGDPTRVVIGERNVFREHVTIHRGMPDGRGETRVGNDNLFLVGSHVGHDAIVGDGCILANSALVGGHAELCDRVFLSGNSAVHQQCRMGRLSLLSGCSATSKDVPPFIVQQMINRVMAVNVIGMRRANIPAAEIQAVRQAFQILYRQGKLLSVALFEIEAKLGHSECVREMTTFIRTSTRGICGPGRLGEQAA